MRLRQIVMSNGDSLLFIMGALNLLGALYISKGEKPNIFLFLLNILTGFMLISLALLA